ncbi:MAG: insulinase family protein [Deltaproteobacteria bacterium]|nr:insulinase family protein [Deltaproteobacteria bacterium]
MVRNRFYGKVVFVVFCLVVLVYTRSYGKPQTTPPTDDLPEVGSRLINRVIPSKDKDLFVVLKNGLTVLIRESHASDVVSCRIMVKTGSVFEGEDTGAGLSHYLEHVVSGGTTAKFTEAEIKEKLRAIGGATNAYTSYDDTAYFIDTISVHYGEALELLVSYVTQCQFNEMEYAREKKVILQEFQMRENNPSRQLWQSFMETAYRRHPVRYPIIGQREVFAGIDKKRLSSYYDRCYVPGNMVLVVVGNVDKEDALNVILDLVKGVKRAKNPFPVLPTEPRQLSSRNVEKSLPLPLSWVMVVPQGFTGRCETRKGSCFP